MMNMLRISCFVIALLCAVAMPTNMTAQSSHRAAAKELYQILGGDKIAVSAAETMIKAMYPGKSVTDSTKKIILDWCKEVFTDPDCVSDMIDIYERHFSEQEIRDLIKFYKTDLGNKVLTTMPITMQEGALVGSKYAQKYQQRLIDRLKEK